MKKRLISMLLTVLMVMSLFSGLSVSAYAEDSNVIEYTMTNGDTVLAVCNSLGLNYYTCKKAIMLLNGFTSDNSFSHIPVGKVIKLPASNAIAQSIAANGTGSNTTTGNTTGNTNNTITNSNGETVAYYLVPYTMQRGDTVYTVCNALGIKYNTYADQIQKINGIKSLSWVKAGQTILFPSPTTPAVGVSCYQVLAHKVSAGETAYTICNSSGVSYNGNLKLLQALNNKENLNYITANSTFYLPVATVISAPSTGSGSTGGNGSGGSSTATATPAPTATPSPVTGEYNITPDIGSNMGTLGIYVNNKAATKAVAGDLVTITVTPNEGKAVSSITVKFSNGDADLRLTANSFTMPKCDVRVVIQMKSGFDITLNSSNKSITKVLVDGIEGDSAVAGSVIKVASSDPSYVVEEITATYRTLLGRRSLTITNNDSFIMPSKDVEINATLKTVPTFNFYIDDKEDAAKDGVIILRVDGNNVAKAAKGSKVEIYAVPSRGYLLEGLLVTNDKTGENIIEVVTAGSTTFSFTMPESTVTLTPVFGLAKNDIIINAIQGAKALTADYTHTVNGKTTSGTDVDAAPTGATITLNLTSETGFDSTNFDGIVITRNADGHLVPWLGSGTFIMPAGGVTITGTLVGDEHAVTLAIENLDSAGLPAKKDPEGNTITIKANGNLWNTSDSITTGSKVALTFATADGYAFTNYSVTVTVGGTVDQTLSEEITELANSQGYFTMPDGDVDIVAKFTAGALSIRTTGSGKGTVSFQVLENDGTTWSFSNSFNPYDTVKIICRPSDGYGIVMKDVTLKIRDTEKAVTLYEDAVTPGEYTFTMPPEGVDLFVGFNSTVVTATLKTSYMDKSGKLDPDVLQGKSLWFVQRWSNGQQVVENTAGATKTQLVYGEKLRIDGSYYGVDNAVNNYKIKYVEYNGKRYEVPPYDFITPNQDFDILVVLEDRAADEHLVATSINKDRGAVSCLDDADMTITDKTPVKAGATVNVTATATNRYRLDKIQVIGVTSGAIYESIEKADIDAVAGGAKKFDFAFTMPKDENVKIVVTHAVDDIAVEIAASFADGSAVDIDNILNATTSSGSSIVKNGSTFTAKRGDASTISLTATGAADYQIKSVSFDGGSVKTVNSSSYNFTMPDQDAVKINVVLEKLLKKSSITTTSKYGAVTYSDAATGDVLSDLTAIAAGTEVKMTATATAGYLVKSIAVKAGDGTVVKNFTDLAADSSFIMPSFNVTVEVSYVAETYSPVVEVVDSSAAVISDNAIVQVKRGSASPVTLETSGDKVNVCYYEDIQVSLNVVGQAKYKLTGVVVTDNNGETTTIKVSGTGDIARTFKVPATGCATITVTLALKS